MKLHSSAKSCPASRRLLVDRVRGGMRMSDACAALGVSRTTGYKWLRRFEAEGASGLADRSSAPRRSPRRTPTVRLELVLRLRREHRMNARAIGAALRMPRSTVSRLLARHGLGPARSYQPKEAVVRYEHKRPGDLVHLDIKRLVRFSKPGHRVHGDRRVRSRGARYEYVHVAIDDFSRAAFVEVLDGQSAEDAIGFLARARAWFASIGIPMRRLLTDNGSCYVAHSFAKARKKFGIRHGFTRPYRPQTNGKAERFIKTLLAEWAYSRPYYDSNERRRVLTKWLRHYNYHRPHGSLGARPPQSRFPEFVNNVRRKHI